MRKEMTIVEARTRLTQLPEELGNDSSVTITRRGKPVLAVLPYELYDSIVETLEIMADSEQTELLRRSIHEADAGNTIAWETVKQELNV